MGMNCVPLLADLFLYSYESEFLDNMIRSGHRKFTRLFNLCYQYIDDLIVFNKKKWRIPLKEVARLLWDFYCDSLRSLILLSLDFLSQKS